MRHNNGQTMTLKAPNGKPVRVRLEVNTKARRLILRVDERKREAVAVAPSRRQIKDAAAFAAERVEWISSRLNHLPEAMKFTDGAIIQYRGEPCQITSKGTGRIAKLVPGDPPLLSAPGDPDLLEMRVRRYLKKQSRADIKRAVENHTKTLGVTFKGISVKDTRSRWGSCTHDGQLSFSWRLILAPREVLNYVAAHECAHLIEMNHSRAFWKQVERCMPEWKTHRHWLREHGAHLQTAGE